MKSYFYVKFLYVKLQNVGEVEHSYNTTTWEKEEEDKATRPA